MDARRIALVPPRYGAQVVGGAEAVIRRVAHGLADRGWSVDVLTTTARDHFTWADEEPAGPAVDRTAAGAEVRVTRFPVVRDTSGEERARVEALLQAGDMPSLGEQEAWMNDGPRWPELFHHVLDTAESYQAVVVSPYPFWTTFAIAGIAPEQTLLRPCLHDEPYARMELFEPVLTGSAGVWLQTEPELELYRRISTPPPQTRIVGEGVEVPAGYDPARVRRELDLGDRAFVLYGGRREGAKGWEGLLHGFAEAVRKEDLDLTLVTFGSGVIDVPPDVADRVIDLGYVDDRTRDDLLAAACAYVQPSALESFSRTIMEAWLAGTPVIANGASDVVRWHIERAGAGLTYADPAELEQALRFVAEAPDQAAALAAPGRQYVLDHYTWPTTLDAMEATLDEWFGR
ncbi:glycosyltransferase family 4 protein [Iamia sp. SCSIO 61187]|uniref:glycosyltransferase family 4 protein n=1 Tax=Iamia sp. SCSIO 61187 TaxID=2722752 RepID=UPI001C62C922|nr:glycosyltransferase family 4 protein [Iamia sp. SCSIO 61187]QYG92585.1 glycosyltransferase family 4 protein [Iamia sp. SCSIO 61187]